MKDYGSIKDGVMSWIDGDGNVQYAVWDEQWAKHAGPGHNVIAGSSDATGVWWQPYCPCPEGFPLVSGLLKYAATAIAEYINNMAPKTPEPKDETMANVTTKERVCVPYDSGNIYISGTWASHAGHNVVAKDHSDYSRRPWGMECLDCGRSPYSRFVNPRQAKACADHITNMTPKDEKMNADDDDQARMTPTCDVHHATAEDQLELTRERLERALWVLRRLQGAAWDEPTHWNDYIDLNFEDVSRALCVMLSGGEVCGKCVECLRRLRQIHGPQRAYGKWTELVMSGTPDDTDHPLPHQANDNGITLWGEDNVYASVNGPNGMFLATVPRHPPKSRGKAEADADGDWEVVDSPRPDGT